MKQLLKKLLDHEKVRSMVSWNFFPETFVVKPSPPFPSYIFNVHALKFHPNIFGKLQISATTPRC